MMKKKENIILQFNKRIPNSKLRTTSNGFTLLEILIAVGILAVMMLSITQITGSILTKKDRNQTRLELQHGITIVITKMTDDLRMAFLADSKFHGKDQKYKTGFKGTENTMNFSTMSQVHFIKNNKDTDQVQVGYFTEKDSNSNLILKRRQTNYLLDNLEEGGRSFVLLKNISQFELEYYDANKKEWQKKWDTDSISAAGKLPQMVKIKLGILGEAENEDEEKKEYYYEFLVEVPMYNTKISF